MNPFVKAKIYQTLGIAKLCKENADFKTQIIISLARFYAKDWGESTEETVKSNDYALEYTDMITASYETDCGYICITAESSDKLQYNTITISLPQEL